MGAHRLRAPGRFDPGEYCPARLGYTTITTAGLEADDLDLQETCTSAEPTGSSKQNMEVPTLAVIEGEKFTLVDSATFTLRGIE